MAGLNGVFNVSPDGVANFREFEALQPVGENLPTATGSGTPAGSPTTSGGPHLGAITGAIQGANIAHNIEQAGVSAGFAEDRQYSVDYWSKVLKKSLDSGGITQQQYDDGIAYINSHKDNIDVDKLPKPNVDAASRGYPSSTDHSSDTIKDMDKALDEARKRTQSKDTTETNGNADPASNTDSARAQAEQAAVDAARKGYDPETQYLELDPTTGNWAVFEYDSDEAKGFVQRLRNLALDVQEVSTTINNKSSEIQLNPETLAKLGGDMQALFADVIKNVNDIYNSVESLVTDAKNLIEKNEGADFDPSQLPNTEEEEPKDNGDPGYTGGDGGSSGGHDSYDDDDSGFLQAPLVPGEQTPQIENTELIAASIGSLVFTTAINLYEKIGGTAIQSNANAQYGLLGVEKVNDVFYYKMIDKTTGKIYYAMASDVKVGDSLYEVETLHTKEESMLLNSTDIGAEDNFEKLADVDKYFVVIEKQEVNGIEFATVLDPTDGKKYYVPISASTEYENINAVANIEPASDHSVGNEIQLDIPVYTAGTSEEGGE